MHHFLPELKLGLIARDFKDDFSILRVRVRGGIRERIWCSKRGMDAQEDGVSLGGAAWPKSLTLALGPTPKPNPKP